jgi:hypothetical protein
MAKKAYRVGTVRVNGCRRGQVLEITRQPRYTRYRFPPEVIISSERPFSSGRG